MPLPPRNTDRNWMTTAEVATVFEVTTETVRDWITAGKLTAEKVNSYNRVTKAEVARFARLRFGIEDSAEPPPT